MWMASLTLRVFTSEGRGQCLTTKLQEKKRLSSVLVSNEYPASLIFVQEITKTKRLTAEKEPTRDFKSNAVLPYIKGVSFRTQRFHNTLRTKQDTFLLGTRLSLLTMTLTGKAVGLKKPST